MSGKGEAGITGIKILKRLDISTEKPAQTSQKAAVCPHPFFCPLT
jgi:hypothetical protein